MRVVTAVVVIDFEVEDRPGVVSDLSKDLADGITDRFGGFASVSAKIREPEYKRESTVDFGLPIFDQ